MKISLKTNNKYNYKKMFHSCWSLMKLFNSQYWNNYSQWLYDVVFSVFFLAFFGFMNQAMFKQIFQLNDPNMFKEMIIGLIVLQIISVGCFSMPIGIMEFKTSILMKMIGSSPIKPWMFIVTAVLFYFGLVTILAIWIIIWTAILFGFQQFDIVTSDKKIEHISGLNLIFSSGKIDLGDGKYFKYGVNWGGVTFSLIYTMIVSTFIGLFNVSLSKTASASSIKGSIIYFSCMFLSGMIFPLSTISSNAVLNIFSYFTPYRYTNVLLNVAWLNGNIFNPFDSINETIKNKLLITNGDIIAAFIVPILIIIASFIVMLKFFKWNNR